MIGQDFSGLRFRGAGFDRSFDTTLGVDHVRDATGESVPYVAAGPEGQGNAAIGVGEQAIAQPMFGREGQVLLRCVEGHAEDLDAKLFEFADSVTESTGLASSPGGLGAGIEPQYVALSVQLTAIEGTTALVGGAKGRSRRADREEGWSPAGEAPEEGAEELEGGCHLGSVVRVGRGLSG